MPKKATITPRVISKCYEPKTKSAKYPVRRDTSLSQLKQKAQDAKLKAAAKPVKKPKAKVYDVKMKAMRARELKILKEVFNSKYSALEIFNQGILPGEYAGIVASVMAVSKYSELKQEYEKKLLSARTPELKNKLNTRWKQINNSFKHYYEVGGCPKITGTQIKNMTALLSRDRAVRKILDEIKKRSTLLDTRSGKISALRAEFAIADSSYVDTALPIDAVVSSIIDICDFNVTVTHTHPILIDKPFELTTDVWCPTWDDWDRTCEMVLLGGRLRVLINLVLEITIGCFGVNVKGAAVAQGCIGKFYTDFPALPAIPSALLICGQCWAVAESATVFSKFVGQDGNCSFGLIIEGTTGCNIPLLPFAAGNFTLTIQINAPCVLSVG